MNFSISHTALDSNGAVHTAFNLVPSSWLTIRGRCDVWDNRARWSDRIAFFKPAKSLLLQIGNIDWPDEYGLFSGRFSADSGNDSRYNNWLYGNALSWNGISLGYTHYNSDGDNLMFCLLYAHILNGKTQYALKTGFPFGGCQGITTFVVVDKEVKEQNSTYGGITYQYDTKKIDLNVSVGATTQNHRALPFLVLLKYSYTIGNLDVMVSHYNDTSGLQNSQKLHSDLHSVSESQLFTKITSISITNKLKFATFPSAGIQLSSILVDFQPAYSSIHFMLDNTNEYCRWKVLSKVSLTGNPEKYSLGGAFSYTGFKLFDITLDCSVPYRNSKISPELAKIVISTAPLEHVKLIPAFLLKQQSYDQLLEMSGELCTVVTFRNGTSSQIRIQYPLRTNNYKEGLQFECKTSFVF
jgi:hypothetical protein